MASIDHAGQAEEVRFRNPVQQQGFAILYHVLTLDKGLSDGAFRLYALLLKYAQQKDFAYPGVERLAQDLGVSTRTILSRLAELEEHKLITRQRRFGKSGITWIEDLAQAYAERLREGEESCTFEQACEGEGSCTFEGHEGEEFFTSNVQNSSPKEKEDRRTTRAMDGRKRSNAAAVLSDEQEGVLSRLLEIGMDKVVAEKVVQQHDLGAVRAWVAEAEAAEGLNNPAGFVLSRLRGGKEPPRSQADNRSDDDLDRYVGGEYAEFVEY